MSALTRTVSNGHRVRFSTASPARHTYSSDDDTDSLGEDEMPDPGPSRRPMTKAPPPTSVHILNRQPPVPAKPVMAEPTQQVQPVKPAPPPPRRRVPSEPPTNSITHSNSIGHRANGVSHALPRSASNPVYLEDSLPKAPPRQRPSSSGFFKSNNPFRKKAQQPSDFVPAGISSSKLPPIASHPSSPSGSIRKSSAPPRLPPRRPDLLQSSPPTASSKPKPRQRASEVSSVASSMSQTSTTQISGLPNPSAIIKKSLIAAEQARIAAMGYEPPKAEVLLANQGKSLTKANLNRPFSPYTGTKTGTKARSTGGSVRGGSLRAKSPTASPKPVVKARRNSTTSGTSGTMKRNQIINTVHTALREAAEETPTPQPSPKVVKKVKPKAPAFATLVKKYLEEEPDINIWSCTDLLSGKAKRRYAMIILNQPVFLKEVFIRAWDACEMHICADGGANRLYDLWTPDQRLKYIPDMIKGDLDSLRPDVKAFYDAKGVSIKHDPDQYSTDLMKCIAEVEHVEKLAKVKYSLVFFGGLSGRIDQTVHTMSILQKLRKTRPQTFVISCESLAWVLDHGSHLIDIDHGTMGQTCGILPVGVSKATVTSKGLRWNVGDWETSLGGDVSTSNHLLPTEPVYLKTSRPVLWCVEIQSHIDSKTK